MGKEFRTQLYFYEDHSFDFIRRELVNTCLVERQGEALKMAWKHFYGTELSFPGYKKASATLVTLGFARDIILDPFDKIPKTSNNETNKKPTTGTIKEWIAQIATNMRQIYRAKREPNTWTNRISYLLMAVLGLEALTWLIIWARMHYGG